MKRRRGCSPAYGNQTTIFYKRVISSLRINLYRVNILKVLRKILIKSYYRGSSLMVYNVSIWYVYVLI